MILGIAYGVHMKRYFPQFGHRQKHILQTKYIHYFEIPKYALNRASYSLIFLDMIGAYENVINTLYGF